MNKLRKRLINNKSLKDSEKFKEMHTTPISCVSCEENSAVRTSAEIRTLVWVSDDSLVDDPRISAINKTEISPIDIDGVEVVVASCTCCGKDHLYAVVPYRQYDKWYDRLEYIPINRYKELKRRDIVECYEGLSDDARNCYEEAANIANISVIGCAVMIRGAFERLARDILELNGKQTEGKWLAALTKEIEETLPELGQDFIDLMSIIKTAGNEVHREQKLENELTEDSIIQLFGIFNMIVAQTIEKDAKIKQYKNNFKTKDK